MKKENLWLFIFPILLLCGLLLGEIIKNIPRGLATGALLGIVLTVAIILVKQKEKK